MLSLLSSSSSKSEFLISFKNNSKILEVFIKFPLNWHHCFTSNSIEPPFHMRMTCRNVSLSYREYSPQQKQEERESDRDEMQSSAVLSLCSNEINISNLFAALPYNLQLRGAEHHSNKIGPFLQTYTTRQQQIWRPPYIQIEVFDVSSPSCKQNKRPTKEAA